MTTSTHLGFDAELVQSNSLIAHYINSITTGDDEGGTEILHASGNFVASTNGLQNKIDLWSIANPEQMTLITSLASKDDYSITSVDIKGSTVIAALQNDTYGSAGLVRIFDISDLEDITSTDVEVGIHPDSVALNSAGTMAFTANEAELDEDGTLDPSDSKGSISVINITTGAVTNISFDGFTEEQLGALRISPVAIEKHGSLIEAALYDIEPEYVALSPDENTLFVTLQEANAVAKIDLTAFTAGDSVTGADVMTLLPLGTKDHSLAANSLDASDKDDAINITTHPFKGMYMPDGITTVEIAGETYFITANEGDDRGDFEDLDEKGSYGDALEVKDAVEQGLIDPSVAATLDISETGSGYINMSIYDGDTDGDGDIDEIHTFGGRSFTIWNTDGEVVYDSGDNLDQIVAKRFPDAFDDGRSDNKGSEPEAVETFTIGDKTYLAVGTERFSVNPIFDISNPEAPVLVTAIDGDSKGDISPEHLEFVTVGGKNYLLSSNEVSSTIGMYELKAPVTVGQTTALIPTANTSNEAAELVDGQSGDTDFAFGDFKALATVGEVDASTGTPLTGYPDGQAAYLLDNDTIRVIYQSESYGTMSSETAAQQLANGTGQTGSQIHYIDYNRSQFADFMENGVAAADMVEATGHLYDTIYNFAGEEMTADGTWGNQALVNADGSFTKAAFADSMQLKEGDFFVNSYCGAWLEPANKWGDGIGFANDVWLTAEEWNISSMYSGTDIDTADTVGLASIAVDIATGTAYTVPALGQTGYEKMTPINSGHEDYVVIVLSGYNHFEDSAPLKVYVGRKGVDADGVALTDGANDRDTFLGNNGLLYGKIYGLAVANEDYAGLGIDNIDPDSYLADSYLTNADAPNKFDAKFIATSYQWGGWDDVNSLKDTEMLLWQDANEQPEGYTWFNGDYKTEHAAADPDANNFRYVQNMTNKGGVFGFDLEGIAETLAAAGGDLPSALDVEVTRIISGVDGSLTLETGGAGIAHGEESDASIHLGADKAGLVQPDGLQWVKTADADMLILDEDSGNDYGERKMAIMLDPDTMEVDQGSEGYLLAIAGGKNDPRGGVAAAMEGAATSANSVEFSGSWNVSALVAKKDDGSFYSLEELAGVGQQSINETIALADSTFIGVIQSRPDSGGQVDAVNADAGGQIFMFTVDSTGYVQHKSITDASELINAVDGYKGAIGVNTLNVSGLASDDIWLQYVNDTLVLRNASNRTEKAELADVERIKFSDTAIAFDTEGATSAGGIYRLYQATFARTPDKEGLGFWLDAADKGLSTVSMAEDFTWSAEFQNLYGITTKDNYGTGTDVRDLVTGFYENVLGRAPDAGGLNYYTGVIESHEKTVGRVLAEISDSPENYDATIELIQNGIQYDLWVG